MLRLYDELLTLRDDTIVRLNRLVAFAEVHGAAAALLELEGLEASAPLRAFLPFQAVRAGLLARLDRRSEAAEAYRAALALGPGEAERLWLSARLSEVED